MNTWGSLCCIFSFSLFSCSLRLRNLVNLVDYFPCGDYPGAGSENLVNLMVSLTACDGLILSFFSCSLRLRNPINLVDYAATRGFPGAGSENLVDLFYGIADCVRWIDFISCSPRWLHKVADLSSLDPVNLIDCSLRRLILCGDRCVTGTSPLFYLIFIVSIVYNINPFQKRE